MRSRSQLATAYAPHQPFTFEGGEGACITVPVGSNREASLKEVTRRTISEQIQEYCEAWAERARIGTGLQHQVRMEQTVDRRIISGGVVHVRFGDLIFHDAGGSRLRSFSTRLRVPTLRPISQRRFPSEHPNRNSNGLAPPVRMARRIAPTTGSSLTWSWRIGPARSKL